jgi:hypothetical protein
MNPMAYRGPGQTLVGYEPPPAWSPPTPEQESLREPWIDPTTAFAGGFGANIMRRGLMGALRGGTAAAVADYPLGLATAGVENIDPRLAMPFNIIGGMASGASFERGLENAMAGKAHPVRTARRALGNAMGQVDVWHGSPHSFDRFSMDKIGTGEGAQAFGHGLYFTDLVDVAKHYAKKLSDWEGKTTDFKNLGPLDVFDTETGRSVGGGFHTKEEAKDWIKQYFPKSEHKILKIGIGKRPNVYKATLHKGKHPSEYTYLDWDKPIPKDISDKMIAAYKSGDLNLREDLGTRNFVDGLTGLSKDAFHKKLQDRGFVVKGDRVFNPSGKELPKEALTAYATQQGRYREAAARVKIMLFLTRTLSRLKNERH